MKAKDESVAGTPLPWDKHQQQMADSHTARLCPRHKVQFAICGCQESTS